MAREAASKGVLQMSGSLALQPGPLHPGSIPIAKGRVDQNSERGAPFRLRCLPDLPRAARPVKGLVSPFSRCFCVFQGPVSASVRVPCSLIGGAVVTSCDGC